jgi:hypothetical protein
MKTDTLFSYLPLHWPYSRPLSFNLLLHFSIFLFIVFVHLFSLLPSISPLFSSSFTFTTSLFSFSSVFYSSSCPSLIIIVIIIFSVVTCTILWKEWEILSEFQHYCCGSYARQLPDVLTQFVFLWPCWYNRHNEKQESFPVQFPSSSCTLHFVLLFGVPLLKWQTQVQAAVSIVRNVLTA